MKGIILAGGNGTRMYPITKSVSKQLLCVYDKPMVYYPLATLLLAGIKDILIISSPQDLPSYIKLLGSGNQLGIKISYIEQFKPEGLAQAFIIAEDFIGSEDVCMVLGDNIFHGNGFNELLVNSVTQVKQSKKATVFGYYVNDPNRYGVLGFDESQKITSIDEKPTYSYHVNAGIYVLSKDIIKKSKTNHHIDMPTLISEIIKEHEVNVFPVHEYWLDIGRIGDYQKANKDVNNI